MCDPDRRRLTSATSCRRPTKLVTSAGSLDICRRLEVLDATALMKCLARLRQAGHHALTDPIELIMPRAASVTCSLVPSVNADRFRARYSNDESKVDLGKYR
jgi:hypothetical protein